MSITTEPTPLSYNGDDSTTTFAITWKYFAKADVKVTLRNAAAAETTWVLGTNYTLTDANVDTGGTLTATTAPATGQKIVIELDPDNVQDSSIPRGGAFPSSTVEDELDKAAQRDAKLEQLWNRSLRVPITDTQTGTELNLPIDSERASKFLYFDGNGAPTAAAGTATLGETGLLSQDTESELTIAAGSVTPTVSTHSIDTQADAATDNLDTIVTTNLEDGRLLLIRNNNAARLVTVRDAQGGAGQIITASGDNVTLLGTTNYMLLQRRGTDWYEVQLGKSLGQGQGADIASSAALSVDIPGTFHDVTGTTGITSMDAVGIGTIKILQFDGALTLTHHATNLVLLGGANRTTAAGDIGIYYEYGLGTWREISYQGGDVRFSSDGTGDIGTATNRAGDIYTDSIGDSGQALTVKSTAFQPSSNDGTQLGVSGTAFADLFLASGGIINFAAGDVTMTHAANALNFAGGTMDFASGLTLAGGTDVLDVYDEATWTPVFTFATPGNLSIVYSTQVGIKTITGRVVEYNYVIATSTFTHTTASGEAVITGLGSTNANVTGNIRSGAVVVQGVTKATYTSFHNEISPNSANINILGSGSGVGLSYAAAADMPTTGSVILRSTSTIITA